MDRQLTHRSAARSVIALAAMLAHEIEYSLSGIRGAAQLLEQAASSEDRMLTRLICDEADRIVTLVDRMEVFGIRRIRRKIEADPDTPRGGPHRAGRGIPLRALIRLRSPRPAAAWSRGSGVWTRHGPGHVGPVHPVG